MLEIERIPLRAEAEKLLEVGAYLAHRLRSMGVCEYEKVVLRLPGFGIATVYGKRVASSAVRTVELVFDDEVSQ
jgi:hypothetical protein